MRPSEDPADQPIDAIDEIILAELRAASELADPQPADLDERVQFAIRLPELTIQICRLYDDTQMSAGARGPEHIRAVTFESDSLTIMVTIFPLDADHVRVEGWLAPPAPLRVDLRVQEPDGPPEGRFRSVTAERNGRFVYDDVPRRLVQFNVRYDENGSVPVSVTPPMML